MPFRIARISFLLLTITAVLAVGTMSLAQSASSAEDAFWDDRFDAMGVNNFMDAIVAGNGVVYVGGLSLVASIRAKPSTFPHLTEAGSRADPSSSSPRIS